MKFAARFALSFAICSSFSFACGSPETSNFFADRGGADTGLAGSESAGLGLNEGGQAESSGSGGTLEGDAGRPSTGGAGKNGAGAPGHGGTSSAGAASAGMSNHSAGSANAGFGGAAGSTNGFGGGGANAGSGGAAGAKAGAGGAAGATAGAGGSASGAGGVSGGTGSSGSSGWNGWSGSNGWGGSNWGGAGGGASVCPAIAPQKNEICDVTTPNSCFYAGQACSCLQTASGGLNPVKRWACYGDGVACPNTKPVAGTSCKLSVDAECPYPGNDFCVCSGNAFAALWVCQASVPVCALNKPADDTCAAVKTCSWGSNKDVACFCNGTRWGCEGGF